MTTRTTRTRRSTRICLALTGAVAVATLSACGSSTGGSPASADQTATNIAQDPGAGSTPSGDIPATAGPTPSDEPTAAAVDTSTAEAGSQDEATTAPSVAPAGSGALPGVPAVTSNATDLTKEPVLAPGTGTPGTGLVTRDLIVGSGDSPSSTSNTVQIKYVGAIFSTGKVFDASWTDPTTAGLPTGSSEFALNMVVPGFGEGILGMKVGGRREIVIPPALGYGPSGGQPQAGISATDTIVFIVDLERVVS